MRGAYHLAILTVEVSVINPHFVEGARDLNPVFKHGANLQTQNLKKKLPVKSTKNGILCTKKYWILNKHLLSF